MLNPEFELNSRIKHEPYSWRNPDLEKIRKRKKSKEIEDKLVINAIKELENDIFLVSELFETTPYKIINVQLKHDRKHLKMFEK